MIGSLRQSVARMLSRAAMGIAPWERASIENPSVSLSDPEAWEALYGSGSQSASGVRVTPEKSLSLGAVWQAVSMISGDVARLPLDIYRRTDDGRETDKRHPVWWLVRHQPNEEQHAFRFWRTLLVHCLLWQNGYAWIEHDHAGRPIGLYPLLPDRTRPARDRETKQLVYVTETTRPDGEPWLRAMWPWEILHFAGLSLDGTAGANMVKHARHAWGLALARQGFESKFFKHGARSGGILELPLGSSEKFQNNVAEGFRKHHEGEDNWFKTVILRDGVKFHQTSFNAEEVQLTESSERSVREVGRFFNLAPSRLGVEGSTSYNSKHEDNKAYLDTTLAPWLTEITFECESKLLTEQERRETHYMEHNTAALLRMDLLKRYQAYSIGIRNRWMTPNMVLAKENEPLVDWGDEPVPVPGAAGGADKGGEEKPRGPADGGGAEGKSGDGGIDLERRRILFRLADHARAKAKKGGRAFGEWIDAGLPTHRQEARERLRDTSPVDDCLRRLEALLDAPVSELQQRVEALAREIESEA